MATLRQALATEFPVVRSDIPMREAFDSLGLSVAKMLFEDHGIEFNPELSIDDVERLESNSDGRPTISIVCLGEPLIWRFVTRGLIDRLASRLGVAVTFEQISAPPAAALLNDLAYVDARSPLDERFASVAAVLSRIRNAGVLIVDDLAEYFRASWQHVPVLSDCRAPEADRLAWRHQRYTARHHELPIEIMRPEAVMRDVAGSLHALSEYVAAPIFRVAVLRQWSTHTRRWEFVAADYDRGMLTYDFDPEALWEALSGFVARRRSSVKIIAGGGVPLAVEGLHFCCDLLRKSRLDRLVERHNRFLIYGPKSSGVYLQQIMGELGRPATVVQDWQNEAGGIDANCVVQTGTWGRPPTRLPIYPVLFAGYAPDNGWQQNSFWFYEGEERLMAIFGPAFSARHDERAAAT